MYIAAIPTKIYTILCRIGIAPSIASTRSNWNMPTNPQLRPPIITNTRAIQSTTFFSAMAKSPLAPTLNFIVYKFCEILSVPLLVLCSEQHEPNEVILLSFCESKHLYISDFRIRLAKTKRILLKWLKKGVQSFQKLRLQGFL